MATRKSMKLVKYRTSTGRIGTGVLSENSVMRLQDEPAFPSLSSILDAEDPMTVAQQLSTENLVEDATILAPIDNQEVWAAGVTYKRSKTARMEESEAAASCYDRVYVSDRPELFFKATPHRVVGPHQAIRLRYDSKWNVPEPELALVLNSRLDLVGYTIGNDVSSRDIEGENPLYLPQAKVYDACCALGPCITLVAGMPQDRTQIKIELQVRREEQTVYQGTTSIGQMARSLEDLIHWLGRDNSFPNGAILLTGTGIVPDSDFTLQHDDLVDITIDGIGTLTCPVEQSVESS